MLPVSLLSIRLQKSHKFISFSLSMYIFPLLLYWAVALSCSCFKFLLIFHKNTYSYEIRCLTAIKMTKTTTLLEVLAWLFAGCLPQAFTSCYLQCDPYLPCNPEVMLWQGEQQWMTKGTKSPQIEKRRQHGVIPLARVADGGEPFKMAPLSCPALCSAHPSPPHQPLCIFLHTPTDCLTDWVTVPTPALRATSSTVWPAVQELSFTVTQHLKPGVDKRLVRFFSRWMVKGCGLRVWMLMMGKILGSSASYIFLFLDCAEYLKYWFCYLKAQWDKVTKSHSLIINVLISIKNLVISTLPFRL